MKEKNNRCKFCEEKKPLSERIILEDISKDYKCTISLPYRGIVDILSNNNDMNFEIVFRIKYCPICGKKLI